jgi:hypothetical protein
MFLLPGNREIFGSWHTSSVPQVQSINTEENGKCKERTELRSEVKIWSLFVGSEGEAELEWGSDNLQPLVSKSDGHEKGGSLTTEV